MEFLFTVLALLAAGLLGWPVTAGVLRLARAVEAARPTPLQSDPAADQELDLSAAAGPRAGPGSSPAPGSVLRGGLVIGVLERVAVAAAVLASEPVAIAYVVAIKGLGRYAELKDTPAAAERFIIGTLTSMLWAVGVAAAARAFLL